MRAFYFHRKISPGQIFFCAVMLLAIALPARAGNLPLGPKVKFQHISMQQGLSVSSIHDIHQDRQGYMWFATAHGTDRFDGYDFLVHKTEINDSTSIGDHRTHTIFEDRAGDLWFGTSNGILARYNRENQTFTNFPIAPPELHTQNESIVPTEYPVTYAYFSRRTITAIAEDAHGNLWLATWGAGIAIFNKKAQKFV